MSELNTKCCKVEISKDANSIYLPDQVAKEADEHLADVPALVNNLNMANKLITDLGGWNERHPFPFVNLLHRLNQVEKKITLCKHLTGSVELIQKIIETEQVLVDTQINETIPNHDKIQSKKNQAMTMIKVIKDLMGILLPTPEPSPRLSDSRTEEQKSALEAFLNYDFDDDLGGEDMPDDIKKLYRL